MPPDTEGEARGFKDRTHRQIVLTRFEPGPCESLHDATALRIRTKTPQRSAMIAPLRSSPYA